MRYVYAVCSVTQTCPTLCDPMDCSLPGSSVHGIFQARRLEWVATSYFRGSSWPWDQACLSCISQFWSKAVSVMCACVCVCLCVCTHVYALSRVQLYLTPWTIAYQAPLPVAFSRQEPWSRLTFSSPGDLSNPGIKPVSPTLADGFFTDEPLGKPHVPIIATTCWHSENEVEVVVRNFILSLRIKVFR